MTPPKCRVCGKSEWQHVCSGSIPSVPTVKPEELVRRPKPVKAAGKPPRGKR